MTSPRDGVGLESGDGATTSKPRILAMSDPVTGSRGLPANVRVGCSSFTANGWVGPFYPRGMPPADFLRHYATRFDTVEVDATFYAAPSRAVAAGWNEKTPAGFVLSAKVPQAITHEKELVDCEDDVRRFVDTMTEALGPKLGPLVLQFAYVAKGKDPEEYKTGARFIERLAAFLDKKPPGARFALEVRNATWLGPPLLALLRAHGVALVVSDYFTMPDLGKIERQGLDPLTADFSYVRFIGDRKRIEAKMAETKPEGRRDAFDEIVVDRGPEMERWIPPLRRLATRAREIYVYFNNHYAGFAPESVRLFEESWARGERPGPAASP